MADTQGPKPIGQVWKIAAAGTAAIVLAAAFDLVNSSNIVDAIRVLLTLGGALTIGIALYQRPGHVSLYVLACVAAIIARFGFPKDWDSGVIASGFAAIVAGVGAVLTALPTGYRKVAASVLLLLHFGGICVAVTSPLHPPWLSGAIGALVYRPYLQAAYLTNAYHFYSPQPGPASQVWFCVKYGDDFKHPTSQRWYKFPRRPDDLTDPLGLSYYRRLSLTMNLENSEPSSVSDDMKRRRIMMAQGDEGIPINPEIVPLDMQFRVPQSPIRDFVLPSYVQHIANLKLLQHPNGVPICSIRVYLVTHNILLPGQLELGVDPYDPITYFPFYFGEYDTSGKLLDANNPLLYWLIPIIRVPNAGIEPWHTPKTHPNEFRLIDGVKLHNGNVDHDMAHEWSTDKPDSPVRPSK
jgi:hypothetical protein